MRQQRRGLQLDWGKATPPSGDSVVDWTALEPCPVKESLQQELLNKIAIVKLNGGLGTSMGCKMSSKSAIHVRGGLSFLDLCVRAVEHLNTKHSVDVPLLLMNSFRSEDKLALPFILSYQLPYCAVMQNSRSNS
jgi:UTP--glucose-1-phosphate uridylyltransferase